VKDEELLVQSTFTGHVPKGVWVAKAIAGGELYVFCHLASLMKDPQDFTEKITGIIIIIFIVFGIIGLTCFFNWLTDIYYQIR